MPHVHGQTKVGHSGLAGLVHQNVGRLQVAVVQVLTVNIGYGIRNANHEVRDLPMRQGDFPGVFAQVSSVHVLLNDERTAVLLFHAQHGDDARMLKIQRLAGFLQKHLAKGWFLSPFAAQDFCRQAAAAFGSRTS